MRDGLTFIVGGPKTASTSLCGLLNCHPDVFIMCEVFLNQPTSSRWKRKLFTAYPDLEELLGDPSGNPLDQYRKAQDYFSNVGFKFQRFGDKFASIADGNLDWLGASRVIFSVRYLPEWIAKDSVRREYNFDADIVPYAIQYTRSFLQSFLLPHVIHVRLEDFLGQTKETAKHVWQFLDVATPVQSDAWWLTVGNYPLGDPKSALNWWKGHASSATEPKPNDTRYVLFETRFWDEILPIFNRYYDACNTQTGFSTDEVTRDLRALNAVSQRYALRFADAYREFESHSRNPDAKAELSSRRGSWRYFLKKAVGQRFR